MLLRAVPVFPALRHTGAVPCLVGRRLFSGGAAACNDGSNITPPGRETQAKKVVYPKRKLDPKLFADIYCPEEHPHTRVFDALKFDYNVAKLKLEGKTIPRINAATDILIIGGGVVGSSIAYHLVQRTGPGLSVTVVEKDPPELSTSLNIGNNDIYQQLSLQPAVEMAQYAAEMYRKLGLTFSDPDLPPIDIDFLPNNSLQLVPENETKYLDDLSRMYKELNWKHQVLSPSMLKQKFPWINVDGVGAGCLGLQKEGMCNKLKAVAAMRTWAKKDNVEFLQGEVIGFEFVDQSDFCSTGTMYRSFYCPRRAVIQLPSGELYKRQFAYVIIAPGASIHSVMDLLDGNGNLPRLPIQTKKCSSYEIWCPDGPGIEMPMIIEANGLKFRKADITNSYSVWDDTNITDCTDEDALEPDKALLLEKFLPQLIHRVPSLKSAKLRSSQVGVIDYCTWDENIFVGICPTFNNVLIATGFGNHVRDRSEMFFELVKKYFGFGDSQSRHVRRNESESRLPSLADADNHLVPHNQYLPPNANINQMELEVKQIHKFMEEHMRSMMGSFGFTFGSPFSGWGFEASFGDDSSEQFGSFPFIPKFPLIPDPPSDPNSIKPSTNLDPRDEMLKPEFRSRSSDQWSGKDQVLDVRVNNEGIGSVMEEFKPTFDGNQGNNPFFDTFSHLLGTGPFGFGTSSGGSGSGSSSSIITVYSNVNGHTSIEKIVKHPDGKIERTVITDDGHSSQ